MSRNLTTEQYIEKARSIHGDRYDYSRVEYSHNRSRITIVCPEHGPFEMEAFRHTSSKRGCKGCNALNSRFAQEFRKKAKAVHGDRYDYSQARYTKAIASVTIICPEHGPFDQQARHHLNGAGCPACAGCLALDTQEFIRRAQEVHGDRYDYSEVRYTTKDAPVRIICPEHGPFEQRAADHYRRGSCCPNCAQLARNEKQTYTLQQFKDMARAIHGDRYDYSLAEYEGSNTNIQIICAKHGPFWQLPMVHWIGGNCPKCAQCSSKPEEELLELLRCWRPDLQWLERNRKLIRPKELDIYCPELGLALEFNGSVWHSEKFQANRLYHRQKSLACAARGVKLLHIWEWQWRDPLQRLRVLSVLRNALGLTQALGARKLQLGEIEPALSRELQECWHVQGSVGATHHLALWDGPEPRALMTFGRPRYSQAREWELLRYCSAPGYRVVGGASKLLKHFTRQYSSSVMTYASLDRTNILDCMYTKLGFVFDGFTEPGYCWVKGSKRISRYQAQAKKIHKILPEVDLGLSEARRMQDLGYHRLYDAGNARFVL